MRKLLPALALLFSLATASSAQEVRATHDLINGRTTISVRTGPVQDWSLRATTRTYRAGTPAQCGPWSGRRASDGGPTRANDCAPTRATTSCAPTQRVNDCSPWDARPGRRAARAECTPDRTLGRDGVWRSTTGRTQAPWTAPTGRTARPRGPAGWNDCAPARACPTPVRRLEPVCPPAPACQPTICEPVSCEADDAALWRASAQPAQRAVPRAWRDALSSCDWLELHGKLRAAVESPRAQLQLVDALARTSTLSVEQAIGLVATLRSSRDRLVALTLLHPAITDRAAFGRAYSLLAPEDAELLHFRVTKVTDGCVDQDDRRFLRLQAQERELIELLGDVGQ